MRLTRALCNDTTRLSTLYPTVGLTAAPSIRPKTTPRSERLHLQPLPDETPWSPPSPPRFAPLPASICDRNRRFIPPAGEAPNELFAVKASKAQTWRFIRKYDKARSQALVFVDGSCLNTVRGGPDGPDTPCGGSAVVFSPKQGCEPIIHPLELDGNGHTNLRSELRAVLLALKARDWPAEGFDNLVLASDCGYVVNGVCDWLNNWISNGWKKKDGPVANRDMWEAIVKNLRDLEGRGCHVQFWSIPREWNESDVYAKMAARVPLNKRSQTSQDPDLRLAHLQNPIVIDPDTIFGSRFNRTFPHSGPPLPGRLPLGPSSKRPYCLREEDQGSAVSRLNLCIPEVNSQSESPA